MGDVLLELMEQLTPALRSGDLALCERTVADRLAMLPRSPFHVVLDLAMTNDPKSVAASFDDFFRHQPQIRIAAAYTEMNGFDINPDRWYFSAFAYEQYGGHNDYDWLSDWQSGKYEDMVISGLEPLQEVYASSAFRDKQFLDACHVTSLLVVVRFQDLIRRAAPHMQRLRFPLLATAHDYDFIYEVRPVSQSGLRLPGSAALRSMRALLRKWAA